MNANDYNNYMLNLYKDSTLKLFTDNPSTFQYESRSINTFFQRAASIFNQDVAKEYLNRLNNKNYDLIQKMDNYPYMFWKTPQATSQIEMGLEKLQQKYKKQIMDIATKMKAKSENDFYYEGEILDTVNQLLNGELGNYGDTYGAGIFKEFSKDILKVYLGLGENVNVVKQIEIFSSTVYESFKELEIDIDISEFSTFVKKIFKNTTIHEAIDNINFEQVFHKTNTSKLKM